MNITDNTDVIIGPDPAKVWGYGILFVTIISLGSMAGALVLPFTKKSIYKHVMTFMVGLAVGSLVATGLIVLTPKSLNLFKDGEWRLPIVSKMLTIFGGIYMFFLLERFLKVVMAIRQKKKHEARTGLYGHAHHHHHDEEVNGCPPSKNCCTPTDSTTTSVNAAPCNLIDSKVSADFERSTSQTQLDNGYKNSPPDKPASRQIATIAWMIIFGDAVHNFVDGLAIGVAFTQTILTGVSVSVAVICEEIPHELGDFAILLKAGMSVKQAILFNFLSACTCYIGLAVGIVLGQNTFAREWVFALTAGMFLYIALVDMLPEMNNAAEEEEISSNTVCSFSAFLLQNLGIGIGFATIVCLCLFGDDINFEG